jgi:transcriptional regulator with XRE-family HTH domain
MEKSDFLNKKSTAVDIKKQLWDEYKNNPEAAQALVGIGHYLKRARLEAGYTLVELAKISRVGKQTLRNIERFNTKTQLISVIKVAQFLGLEINFSFSIRNYANTYRFDVDIGDSEQIKEDDEEDYDD